MPRPLLIRSNTHPYHVTARTNNKENFPIPLYQLWKVIADICHQTTWLYGAKIHAFVLMPNHIHMIISTPDEDLGKIMRHWMQETTLQVNRICGRSGHVFGGPYHWSIIQSNQYFETAFKYLYRNPVRAKLCNQVEAYEFSTLPGILGLSPLKIPLSHAKFWSPVQALCDEPTKLVHWLNTPTRKDVEILWKKCLLKKVIGSDGYSPKSTWRNQIATLTELVHPDEYKSHVQ